jgi:hypothetical protein
MSLLSNFFFKTRSTSVYRKGLFTKNDFINNYKINNTIYGTTFPLHFKHLSFDAPFYTNSLKTQLWKWYHHWEKKHLRINISSITVIGDSVININK